MEAKGPDGTCCPRHARMMALPALRQEQITGSQETGRRITGEAMHHARWEPLPEAEHAAAVVALRELAAGPTWGPGSPGEILVGYP